MHIKSNQKQYIPLKPINQRSKLLISRLATYYLVYRTQSDKSRHWKEVFLLRWRSVALRQAINEAKDGFGTQPNFVLPGRFP